MIMDSGVTVKDLQSSNGTLIDGEPVSESILLPGQLFQVGEVRLQLAPAAAPMTAQIVSDAHCKFHPHNLSRFLCPKCHGNFCELCVNARSSSGKPSYICRTCAVECTPVMAAVATDDSPPPAFLSQIFDAFKYPLRGDGALLIVVGTMLLLLADGAAFIAKFAPLYGWIAVALLTIFGVGYLSSYLRSILSDTAAGEDRMPQWPEISDFSSDIVAPFRQLLVAVLFCFLPAISLAIYAAASESSADTAWMGWAMNALLLLGAVYFPMAFLGIALFDTVAALNPLLIIPSIVKVLGQYLLVIGVSVGILTLRWLLQTYLRILVPIPLLPAIGVGLIQTYLFIVLARILGLLYRNNKEDLGWFRS